MSSDVGIVRSNVRVKRALDRVHLLYKETEELYHTTILSPQLCELRNLITIAYLVSRAASMRREAYVVVRSCTPFVLSGDWR